jgi:hypothetical protein
VRRQVHKQPHSRHNHYTSRRFEVVEPACPFGHGGSKDIIVSHDTEKMRGSPSLVGRGIANPASLSDFEDYLKSQNKTNVRQILCYAHKYASILETGDASALLVLSKSSPVIRRHAMESLAAFSKYSGCYQRWQQIRQAYSLKWTNGDESLQSLQRFFNPNLTLDSMLQRIKEMMRVLPATMAAVIRFAVLTGLRPSEACESVRLICCKSTD